jgi:hypothetical protein
MDAPPQHGDQQVTCESPVCWSSAGCTCHVRTVRGVALLEDLGSTHMLTARSPVPIR